MANATTNRRTKEEAPNVFAPQSFKPAAASTHYWEGTMQAYDPALGSLRNPAVANAATDHVEGVVKKEVDNSAGAAGDKSVELLTGVFEFVHTDLTVADIGKTVFAVDNVTISRSAAAGVRAGNLRLIDGSKCWVAVGPQYQGAPNAAA